MQPQELNHVYWHDLLALRTASERHILSADDETFDTSTIAASCHILSDFTRRLHCNAAITKLKLVHSQKFFLDSNLYPVLNQIVYQTFVDLVETFGSDMWE